MARLRTTASMAQLSRLAGIVLGQKRLSTDGLAKDLGVSRSTAARIVAGLRRDGMDIVSVRRNGAWWYEVRGEEERNRERWRRSRLRRMAGFAKRWKPFPGLTEDEIIYGRD